MKKFIFIFLLVIFVFNVSCGNKDNKKNEEIKKEIVDICIINPPIKTEYIIGEELNTDGLVVELLYNDDTKEEIFDYDIIYTEMIIGNNTIYVKYLEFEKSFNIVVKDIRKLESIIVKEMPKKVSYFIGDTLDLDGLVIEGLYNDNTREEFFDYEVICDDLIIGDNTIYIEYKGFKTKFNVIVNDVERLELLEYKDFIEKINSSLKLDKYDILFDSIIFGGYRDKDTMIVFDEDNFVKTNIYGYEVAVDEFGYVVETNTNVTLRENGYVISGHGTKAKALREVRVGDFVIYIDDIVFVYKNNELVEQNKIFIEFLNVINKIDDINDNSDYNDIVILINEIIPLLNSLYDSYNEEIEVNVLEKLDIIMSYIINEENNYAHKYSYVNNKYEMMEKITVNENNYLFNSSYNGNFYYGGFRNKDSIVHYNKNTYRERNPYGYEIAVNKDNIVIEKDVLVSLPEDGYILSGHTLGAEFIKSISIGDKIVIKDNIIYCYRDTISSIINETIDNRNNLILILNEHNEKDIPHDYEYLDYIVNDIDENIMNLINSVSDGYFHYDIKHKYEDVCDAISLGYSQLIDYKIDSPRAMWYYPFTDPSIYDDTSYEGVINTLDKFKDMGFNEIILLPFHGDYILYDSEYFYKSKSLDNCSYGEYGNNYLECFITEAHKRGILVNAFTQTFRCFEKGSKVLNETHYQVNIDGNFSKGSIYYYDICSDFVQDTLYSWYIELVSMFDFDKIEYDIIRYSVTNLHSYLDIDVISDISKIEDPGYTEYSMNKFMKKYNLSGNLQELIINNKEVRKNWLLFKEEELIKFIERTSKGIKEVKPDVVITAAVMNDYDRVKTSFLQDYKKWLDMGIIDQIEPMVYSQSNSYVLNKAQYFEKNFSNYDYRIGLGYDLSANNLMLQMIYSDDVGFVFFNASDYLRNDYYNLLCRNYHFKHINDFNNRDEILEVIKDDVIDKINNYYEVKYNESYDDLILLIENNEYGKLEKDLNRVNENMRDYILNTFDGYI